MKPLALSPSGFFRFSLTALSLCVAAALVQPSFAQNSQSVPGHSNSGAAQQGSQDKGQNTAPERARSGRAGGALRNDATTTVVAAHPVVFGLLEVLTKDTSIAAVRATPGKLPPSRHYSYLSGRGAKAFDRVVRGADAVVHLRSIWPDDPLYPMARQHNIRVIEIDAANPVDHSLPGIATSAGAGSVAAYPWLNPVNLGRMADIIGSELERLDPDARPALETNLAGLRQRLVKLNAQVESGLLDAPSLAVVVLSPRLSTLATAFNLDMVPVKDNSQWNEQSLAELGKTIADNNIKIVLMHEVAVPEVDSAVKAAGARVVVVNTDGEDPLAVLEAAGQSLVQAMAADGAG